MIRLSSSFIPESRSNFKMEALYNPISESSYNFVEFKSNRNDIKTSHTINDCDEISFNISNAIRLLYTYGIGFRFKDYCESAKLSESEIEFCVEEYKKNR